MAYYFYINSGINSLHSADQWQGYYSQISSLFQSADDFVNPSSFITLSWPQHDFTKLNDNSTALTPTMVPQDAPIINQTKIVSPEKTKKKAQKSMEKYILSAKKNSQSNIINQFFSFFGNRQKSERVLERCLTLMKKNPQNFAKILSLFYSSIKLINEKRGRKYVNIRMFLQFFSHEQLTNYLPEMVNKLESSKILTMEQLSQIFRRCTKHFLKNISINAILTSKRISIVSKEEHLKKRRKFMRTVLEF